MKRASLWFSKRRRAGRSVRSVLRVGDHFQGTLEEEPVVDVLTIIIERSPEEVAISTVERLMQSTRPDWPGCCVGGDDGPELEEPLVAKPAGTGRCGRRAENAGN
jgi:hypothetical protein